MERVLENDDISILSYFLAIFVGLFSPYRDLLPKTIYMPISDELYHPNINYGGGGGGDNRPSSGHTNLQKAQPVQA